MITAHLPAGYITGRLMPQGRHVVTAALIGGVLPDLDLIWFYWIDERAFHHHRYWVHIPAFWASIACFALPVAALFGRGALRPALAFFAAILVHLCLDTLAGNILWSWPWSDRFFTLIEVPDRWPHWILNFVLHPVFIAEIAIWVWAVVLLRRRS